MTFINVESREIFSVNSYIEFLRLIVQSVNLTTDIVMCTYFIIIMEPHVRLHNKLNQLFEYEESPANYVILERISRRCLVDIIGKILCGVLTIYFIMNTGIDQMHIFVFLTFYLNVLKQNLMFVYFKFLIHFIIDNSQRMGQELLINQIEVDELSRRFATLASKLKEIIAQFHNVFGFVIVSSISCGFLLSCMNLFMLVRLLLLYGLTDHFMGYTFWTLLFFYDFLNVFTDFESLYDIFPRLEKRLLEWTCSEMKFDSVVVSLRAISSVIVIFQ